MTYLDTNATELCYPGEWRRARAKIKLDLSIKTLDWHGNRPS